MSSHITVDASKHAVRAVTVFQHRAEVVRDFRLNLKSGQTEISIECLPNCLDESSLRIDGVGNATILDVAYNPPLPMAPSVKSSSLRELESERSALIREEKLLRTKNKLLEEYTRTVNAGVVNTGQLVEFLSVYQSEGGKTLKALDSLQERLLILDSEIGGERRRLAHSSASSIGVRVQVIVSAEHDGPAALTLSYVVSNATWTPQYDLRATVETNSKAPSSVRVHYRASVHQTTGEEWRDAMLVLSTSSPLRGASIPELYPWHIGSQEPKPLTWRGTHKSISLQTSRHEQESSTELSRSPIDDWSLPTMQTSSAPAREGVMSTSYTVNGRTTIPSDASTHTVHIATIDLASDLEWITVPKESPSAFLQCQIRNTSPYVLLHGPANIFLDNSFVTKSFIPAVSPQEQFSCSLGVDPSIRITYHPLAKKSRTAGYLLSSKSDTTCFTQRITIKNTRSTAVPKLLVRDHIPVSEDAKFKVNLLEPKDLASTKVGVPVDLSPGLQASWVRANTDDLQLGRTSSTTVGMEDADGRLEWACNIAAGQTREITLAWEVVSPTGERWYRQ